jgi:hypothetical protein
MFAQGAGMFGLLEYAWIGWEVGSGVCERRNCFAGKMRRRTRTFEECYLDEEDTSRWCKNGCGSNCGSGYQNVEGRFTHSSTRRGDSLGYR